MRTAIKLSSPQTPWAYAMRAQYHNDKFTILVSTRNMDNQPKTNGLASQFRINAVKYGTKWPCECRFFICVKYTSMHHGHTLGMNILSEWVRKLNNSPPNKISHTLPHIHQENQHS